MAELYNTLVRCVYFFTRPIDPFMSAVLVMGRFSHPTVWLECYAGKIFLPKLHTPTHISLESLYKAGHDDIVNGAIKHL